MAQQSFTQVHKQAPVPKQKAGGILQRKCNKCREKDKILQRSAVSSAPESVPSIVHEVLRSPGQQLDKAEQASTRPHFSYDFSQIPVHSMSQASIQAKLAVNTPGDFFEQEADRIAKDVIKMPSGAQSVMAGSSYG